jgi:hypothetical protein
MVYKLLIGTVWCILLTCVLNRLAVIAGSDIKLPFSSFREGVWVSLFNPDSSRRLFHSS